MLYVEIFMLMSEIQKIRKIESRRSRFIKRILNPIRLLSPKPTQIYKPDRRALSPPPILEEVPKN